MTRPDVTIGARARMPNPALQPFAVLVGRWRTEGSHGLLPGITLHGHASIEWIENGAFLLMRSEIDDDPRFPHAVAIIGSDDVQQKFFLLHFDERGVSRRLDVSIEHNVITWWRDQPGFSQRTINTIASDGNIIVSKGELSKDGVTWEKDLEMTYSREV